MGKDAAEAGGALEPRHRLHDVVVQEPNAADLQKKINLNFNLKTHFLLKELSIINRAKTF